MRRTLEEIRSALEGSVLGVELKTCEVCGGLTVGGISEAGQILQNLRIE